MAVTLKASKKGLEKVDDLRRRKGWKKADHAWSELALVGTAALKKFWRREAIFQKHFVSICETVGANWEEIVESVNEKEKENTSKANQTRWLLELNATIDEADKSLIKTLFERLGYPSVRLLSIDPSKERPIQNWQSVDSVMPRGSARSTRSGQELPGGSVSGAKEIELGATKVVLVVQMTPESEAEVGVSIEIYPSKEVNYLPAGKEANYLPAGLEVTVIDESDAIVLTEKVGTKKDSLKIELGIEAEEWLTVTMALGEVRITEAL